MGGKSSALSAEGRFFDLDFYSQQAGIEFDDLPSGLSHYLGGDDSGQMLPHPVLDPGYVAEQAGNGPLSPRAAWRAVLENAAPPFISPHRLFEPDLYLRNLPHAAQAAAQKLGNPVLHFLSHWHEHRVRFSRYFDPEFYLCADRSLADPAMNPLHHYARQPAESRADANPMFHAGHYALTYGRQAADMLADFIAEGHKLMLLPNPWALHELRDELPLSPAALLSYIEV